MAHTMWKGTFTLGLATVPVRMHAAVDDREISFTTINAVTGNRIGYRKVDVETGEEVLAADQRKALPVGDGFITITDDELAAIKLTGTKTIATTATIPDDHLDPRYARKCYWLTPDGPAGAQGYTLVAQALHKTRRAAFGTIVLRDCDWACTVSSPDGVHLLLTTLNWHSQMREIPAVDPATVDDQMLEMAMTLIEGMADDALDISALTSEYMTALNKVIETASTEHLAATPEPAQDATDNPVADLLAALKASVEAQKADASTA